jgi:hypothetical protein
MPPVKKYPSKSTKPAPKPRASTAKKPSAKASTPKKKAKVAPVPQQSPYPPFQQMPPPPSAPIRIPQPQQMSYQDVNPHIPAELSFLRDY